MKSLNRIFYIPLLFLCVLDVVNTTPLANSNGAEIKFISQATQTTMIELYTSEGCSSCPPAEARLNRYESDPELWKSIIPIAFHVDYWDYIGWRDRFASPLHGKRQSRYAKLNHQRTVYTPAFVINGKNWRPGLIFSNAPDKDAIRVGTLSLTISNKTLDAYFEPINKTNTPLLLNIAILGMDLHSDIKRGENSGRRAEHHFVALAQKHVLTDNMHWNTDIPSLQNIHAPRYALVAWISRPNHPAPVQAVGGYIPSQLVE